MTSQITITTHLQLNHAEAEEMLAENNLDLYVMHIFENQIVPKIGNLIQDTSIRGTRKIHDGNGVAFGTVEVILELDETC